MLFRSAEHVVEVTKGCNERMLAAGTHPFQRPRTEEFLKRSGERLTTYNKSDHHRMIAKELGRVNLAKSRQTEAFQRNMAASNSKTMIAYNLSPERMAAYNASLNTEKGIANRTRASKLCLEFNGSPQHLAAISKYAESDEGKSAHIEHGRRLNHMRWHLGRSLVNPECSLCAVNNHKVVSVRECGHADVFDLTVDHYHNFATSAGVFVHNCEDDVDGYQINGILVSDFVYPAWSRPGSSGPYDFRSLCTAPLEVRSGGYVSVLNVAADTQWVQIQKEEAPAHPNTRSTRRLELRNKPSLVRSTR